MIGYRVELREHETGEVATIREVRMSESWDGTPDGLKAAHKSARRALRAASLHESPSEYVKNDRELLRLAGLNAEEIEMFLSRYTLKLSRFFADGSRLEGVAA